MEEEDTIELIDLLRVVWKWKWVIIISTLACAIAAGIISFSMPKIYEVSMIIGPGIIGMGKDKEFIYLNSSANIGEEIKGNVFNYKITEKLNIDPLKTAINFKANTPKHSRFIKVISEWEENKVELGLEVLKQLFIQISNQYEKMIKTIRDDYDKQILEEKNKIKKIETQRKDIGKQILLKLNKIEGEKDNIKLNEANLKIIGDRERELLQEIKNVKDNTAKIVSERNNMLKHKGSADNVSLLLYSTVIQQSVAYFNRLGAQINELRKEEEKLETDIDKLGKDIDNINTEIERLNLNKTEGLQTKIDDIKLNIDRLSLQKDLIENIKIIQAPKASLWPIKPKKKLNVILAFVIGLFISIFLAFFLEYLQKMGVYPKSSTIPSQTPSVKN